MKKAIIYIVIGITYAALLYAIPDIYDIPIFTLSIILWALCSIAFYITEKFYGRYNSVDELEYAISQKFDSEGFKCRKEEGRFVFQMDGRTFRTYFWNLGDGMFRTEFLDFVPIISCILSCIHVLNLFTTKMSLFVSILHAYAIQRNS